MSNPSALAPVLRLPREVVCEGIFPYLFIDDLKSLATAFDGIHFTDLLQSYRYSSPVEISLPDIKWLQNRGVSLVAWSLCIDHLRNLFDTGDDLTHLWILLGCGLKQKNMGTSTNDINVSTFPFSTLTGVRIQSFERHHVNYLLHMAKPCPELQSLRLPQGDYIDGDIIRIAQSFSHLHTISVCSSNITDIALLMLCRHCPRLRHIELHDCHQLTDPSVITIAITYPHLRSLLLTGSKCSDTGIMILAGHCHRLTSVTLRLPLTSTSLAALWTSNPNLTAINISSNRYITDNDIVVLVECCRLLLDLSLKCCSEITDAAVIAVAEHCPQLTSLNIGYCRKISDNALMALGQHCQSLEALTITDAKNVTDDGVSALARGCCNLRILDANNCKKVGLHAVSAVAEHCPMISELYLRNCDLDDASLHTIAQICRNITVLNVAVCGRRISLAAVTAIVLACVSLRRVILYVSSVQGGLSPDEFRQLMVHFRGKHIVFEKCVSDRGTTSNFFSV